MVVCDLNVTCVVLFCHVVEYSCELHVSAHNCVYCVLRHISFGVSCACVLCCLIVWFVDHVFVNCASVRVVVYYCLLFPRLSMLSFACVFFLLFVCLVDCLFCALFVYYCLVFCRGRFRELSVPVPR